jgi:L-lactate dehydrogenase complex protein LldG
VIHNEAREAILASIRSAVKGNRDGYDMSESAPSYLTAGRLSLKERLDLFVERLREYDAQVMIVDTEGAAAAIAGMLRASNEQTLPWVVADGFPAAWLAGCPMILRETEAGVEELNRCAGVVTACSVGIAVTGTLVLRHGAGEGRRRTSLIPDRHLCVVRASQVVETVPEAFARLRDASTQPLTFISGPSATADIEMTRIRGVHGPRQLHVILVLE